MWEFYFRFRFSPLRHHWHVILHSASACHISSKSDHLWHIYDVIYRFFKMAATALQFFRFHFRDSAHLEMSKSTRKPNFGKMFQSTADILLHPVSENKRPLCWNSTSGFDFYLCIIISIPFCICRPNFVQIGLSAVDLRHHDNFQDGGRQPYWIFPKVTVDHPQSANEGLSSVVNFRLDRI